MQKKKSKYLAGVDIGGTKILACLMDSQFKVVAEAKKSLDANQGLKAFWVCLTESIREALTDAQAAPKDLAGIGLGCPGMIDAEKGVVRLSPNLSFLKNFPLRKKISQTFRVPAFLENDVNAGLVGEQQFGAAKGSKHAVGIFWGTGVGGAVILDGRIYRGATGAAGEIGHTFLVPPSMISSSASKGTLESLIGRLNLASEAGLLILRQEAPKLFGIAGYELKKLKSKAFCRAIEAGDTAVRELVLQKARILGMAMANAVNLLNPERIILGGGVIEAMGPLIVPAAEAVMRQMALAPMVKNVKVVPARLGDYAAVKGAAWLALEAAGLEGKKLW